MSYLYILLFSIVAALFVGGGLFVSHLVAPKSQSASKFAAYECGERAIGSARIQFNIGFYLFALLFLVFDVEAAFLYPWAVVLRDVGLLGLIEVAIFSAILLVALLYAWKKDVLKWV